MAGALFYRVVVLTTVLAAGHLLVPGADGMAGGASPTPTLSVAARVRHGGMGSLRGGEEPICVGLVALPRRMNVLLQSLSTGAQNERLPLEMLPLDPRGTVDAAPPPTDAFVAWSAYGCESSSTQQPAPPVRLQAEGQLTRCLASSGRGLRGAAGRLGLRSSLVSHPHPSRPPRASLVSTLSLHASCASARPEIYCVGSHTKEQEHRANRGVTHAHFAWNANYFMGKEFQLIFFWQ